MRFECSCRGISQRDSFAFCAGNLPTVWPSHRRYVRPLRILIPHCCPCATPTAPPPPPTHHRRPTRSQPTTTIIQVHPGSQIPLCNPRNFLAGNLRLTSLRLKGGPVKILARFCVFLWPAAKETHRRTVVLHPAKGTRTTPSEGGSSPWTPAAPFCYRT